MTGTHQGRQIILNLHGIGQPSDQVPSAEVPYWLSERQFCDIIERASVWRKLGQHVRFTFDDGNRSDLEVAAKMLLEHGLRADFFVLTGRLESNRYLGEKDIQDLIGMGMEVGLHGQDHVDWRNLNGQDLDRETRTARLKLSEIIGRPVNKVSIPFGAYNRRLVSHLKGLRFNRIYTSDGGWARVGARVQPRNSLRSDMSCNRLEEILAARTSLYAGTRRAISVFLRQNVI